MRNQTVPDKTIPYSEESEQATLGSILIDPDAIWRVESTLRPSDFYLKRHADIYTSVLAIVRSGEKLDYLTLVTELESSKTLKQAGGAEYISGLIGCVPSAMNIESYAGIVADTAVRRGLLNTATDIARKAYNMEQSTDETITWATGTLQSHGRGGDIVPARDVVDELHAEFVNYVDNPLQPGEVRGLNTGWRDLNAYLGGWKPGLYVVLGEPHVGKSWFVLTAAMNVARQGQRALLFSLEMKAIQLVRRLCLSYAGISQHNYDLGRATPDQIARFAEMEGIVSEWNLDIADSMSKGSEILSTIHREMRSDNPPAFIAIDYLGLIETNYKRENNNLEMMSLTRELKNVGRVQQVPIMAPHQISDKAIAARSDKRPQLHDGYGSGGIAQDADVVCGLYGQWMHENTQSRIMEVSVLKDRTGGAANPNAPVQLRFTETGGLTDL